MIKGKFLAKAASGAAALMLLLPMGVNAAPLEDMSLPCEAFLLREGISGKIILKKNEDVPMSPASITKIMTMLLISEALDEGKISLSDEVTVSSHAASMGGSQIWLKENEVMTVDELLKAVCVVSANDASVALGEHLAGSEENFVFLMNQKAEELGLKNTQFKNCTGLDEEGHYTTAEDISTVAMELMKHPVIKNYTTIWMDELRGGKTKLVNTNKMIRFYKGATGLKTGTTDNAGSCLCATAQRDSLPLIAVTLGSKNSKDRFYSCKKLLDLGFSSLKAVKCPELKEALESVRVERGEVRYVGVFADKPSFIVAEKGKRSPLKLKIEKAEELKSPVEKGEVLGSVKIMQDDVILSEIPLLTAYPVGRLTYKLAFNRILNNIFSL